MNPDVFAGIVVALAHVVAVAERLLDGDAEGHVRKSVAEFAQTFARRDAIEPAIERLRDSLLMLHDSRRAGRRRAFEHDRELVTDLELAIEQHLVPELRRVGFSV